jgi:protein-S-isoprenylcysteine O-methyltransferase Ste14
VVVLVLLLGTVVTLLVWLHASLRMLLTGALWVLFVGYWSLAARRKAPTERSESSASRAVHTRFMNLSFLLLFLPVPGLRGRLLPLTPVVTAIGLTVQGLAFLLAVWARRHLGRNWSGAITVAQDHQLVRSGPYRLVRHPIYTAMFGMFVGTVIVSGEVHALLALLVIGGAYWRKIRLEERTLREVFGPAYEAYRRETPALIPFLL